MSPAWAKRDHRANDSSRGIIVALLMQPDHILQPREKLRCRFMAEKPIIVRQ